MAQDQRMGLGLEFLHLVIVRSLVSNHAQFTPKSRKTQAEGMSGARLTGSLSVGLGYGNDRVFSLHK